jgi:Pyridoxamine 5'-phosphate oxidase
MAGVMDTLPEDVVAVFTEFRTAEFATFARDETPVAVEVMPQWQPSAARFLVTSAIGLPNKAYNARRNPKVALLFSDPTGSGVSNPPTVLV